MLAFGDRKYKIFFFLSLNASLNGSFSLWSRTETLTLRAMEVLDRMILCCRWEEGFPCLVGCLATCLAFTHSIPIAHLHSAPLVMIKKMSPDIPSVPTEAALSLIEKPSI